MVFRRPPGRTTEHLCQVRAKLMPNGDYDGFLTERPGGIAVRARGLADPSASRTMSYICGRAPPSASDCAIGLMTKQTHR